MNARLEQRRTFLKLAGAGLALPGLLVEKALATSKPAARPLPYQKFGINDIGFWVETEHDVASVREFARLAIKATGTVNANPVFGFKPYELLLAGFSSSQKVSASGKHILRIQFIVANSETWNLRAEYAPKFVYRRIVVPQPCTFESLLEAKLLDPPKMRSVLVNPPKPFHALETHHLLEDGTWLVKKPGRSNGR